MPRLQEALVCNVFCLCQQDHAVGKVFAGADQPSGCLRQRLQHEHAGQDRKRRKMIGKVLFCQRDGFDGLDVLARLNLCNSINQAEFHSYFVTSRIVWVCRIRPVDRLRLRQCVSQCHRRAVSLPQVFCKRQRACGFEKAGFCGGGNGRWTRSPPRSRGLRIPSQPNPSRPTSRRAASCSSFWAGPTSRCPRTAEPMPLRLA